MIACFIVIGRVMRRERRALSLKAISLVLIFVVFTLSFPLLRLRVTADPRTIVVPDDYSAIQWAVDSASAGDTVFVRSGTYFENVVVNKALTITGENSSSTIVDAGGSGSVFTVYASNVRIGNFTIQGSGTGYPNSGILMVNSSWWCVFRDNVITHNFIGVLLISAYGNIVERNQILSAQYGVYFLNSGGNRVLNNTIKSSYQGIVMFSSPSNTIAGNNIRNNTVGIAISACVGNTFYYNNLVNLYQTMFYSDIYANTWDNGYPAGGNYWSDYRGRDVYKGQYQNITGSDGIGDVPYQLKVNNTDNFPYMNPISVFHDVAVLSVFPSVSNAYQGQVLTISVVVANIGNYTERPSVSAYYVSDSTEVLINTASVANLTAGAQTVVTFEWNTSAAAMGDYVLRAKTGPIEGELNLTNNILDDGIVTIIEPFHDVAVLSVVPSASKVYQGQTLNISVVVANVGSYPETFDVIVYYDEFVIEQRNVANLAIGSQLTLVYSWNTSNVEPGRVYSIRAEASAVVGEVNLDNNVLVDGSVKVRSLALDAIRISQLVPSDHLGNPASSFNRGTIGYFKAVVNSTSDESEIVLVTVNVYDSSSVSLGVVSFKGMIMPGTSIFILGIPIPTAAHSGTARVYANTFTDWPFKGGLPYGPEKSATFQILG